MRPEPLAPPRTLAPRQDPSGPAELATVLAGMTYAERVRAYRSGAISRHELNVAAARLPEDMPSLNGELEWIAIDLVDLG
jgi:hypothetical protein